MDRIGDPPGLDAAQRSWLLQDFREDLDCQIEDAEERGITERGARELVSTHAIVEWLDVGDFPPPAGIELLEKAVARTPRRPSRQERWRRDAYLAAIGELGGDEEAAAKLWRDGVDEPTRVLLDFQGRKLRRRMEELGLTIGNLAERTRIDTVRLVAVLSARRKWGQSNGPGSQRRWTCRSTGCLTAPASSRGQARRGGVAPQAGHSLAGAGPPSTGGGGLGWMNIQLAQEGEFSTGRDRCPHRQGSGTAANIEIDMPDECPGMG